MRSIEVTWTSTQVTQVTEVTSQASKLEGEVGEASWPKLDESHLESESHDESRAENHESHV